ncbi:nitrate/TMAO reductase-like tetraheme cytochrome c subunit [Sinorhizobium meliloti]
MDLSKQTQRAAEIHTRYLLPGKATYIDCHKGIAHDLPNMQPGWKLRPNSKERRCLMLRQSTT